MKTKMNIQRMLFVVMLVLASTTIYAQRRHYNRISHRNYYRPIVTTVVARPAVTMHISNRLSKKDRLDMALAYLNCNESLSVSKYSKMTGLTNAMAEAELDAFVISKNNPIKVIKDGKKKLYVI